MVRRAVLSSVVCAMLLSLAGIAHAVPNVLQYQGRLTDAAGNPQSGNFSIQFAIYSVPSGGVAVWTETQPNVAVASGLFNVVLGSVTSLPVNLFSGVDRYLGITVGTDPEMTPRQRVASVGYALRAQAVDLAPGIVSSFRQSVSTPPGTSVAIDTCTITIPGPGYVIVDGGGSCYILHAIGITDDMRYQIDEVAGVPVSFSEPSWQECYANGAMPSTLYIQEFRCLRIYQKAAAGTYTFYLNMNSVGSGSSDDGTERPYLFAMYVPVSYGSVAIGAPPGPDLPSVTTQTELQSKER